MNALLHNFYLTKSVSSLSIVDNKLSYQPIQCRPRDNHYCTTILNVRYFHLDESILPLSTVNQKTENYCNIF